MFPSLYFTREDCACPCGCGFDTVDGELIRVLNDLRFSFSAKLTFNSVCRCPAHNKEVGGTEGSQHPLGKGGDVKLEGIDPEEVYEHLDNKYPGRYGVGRYKTFTHIDVRAKKARW